MGGNVDGSSDLRALFGACGSGGTLLGPEGAAHFGGALVSFVPGSGPALYRSHCVRGLVVVAGGLGFGGVFVNWIVDASI
jgi:hypothetical protein